MRLILLADIHGHLSGLDAIRRDIADADAVLVAGDITHFGQGPDAQAVLDAIAALGPDVLAVHGNCDGPQIKDLLSQGRMGLNGRVITLGDLQFVGAGGSLLCSGRTPSEQDEQGFAQTLQTACQACRGRLVLVTHQPPYGTRLDLVGGRHAGSTSIRAFIEEKRPLLAICGHFHEAIGIDKLGQTTIVNPGPFKTGHYAKAQIIEDQVEVELRQFHLAVEQVKD